MNPPDHTRLRSLVHRAFTPRRIEAMRASITSLAEECLDDLAERGGGDAIDILGVAAGQRHRRAGGCSA